MTTVNHDWPAWEPDILGPDYQSLTIPLGEDPQDEGEVYATVVRYRPTATSSTTKEDHRPALLWVHGMTDYFFHTHVAEFFDQHGYAVYAVDLRKCGRSHRSGQKWHYCTDLEEYFPDLYAAVDALHGAGHNSIIPIAHSTGGLIVPLWLNQMNQDHDPRFHLIKGLILNSPWLDMMYPKVFVKIATPIVDKLGKAFPTLEVPGGDLGCYGTSLQSDPSRNWDYDLNLKPINGHPKYFGWLRAIVRGQRQIHQHHVDVGVPTLTLCSSASWLNHSYSAVANATDTVLDVQQIHDRAPLLGQQVSVEPIQGARHDVFCSLHHAQAEAFAKTLQWLNSIGADPSR
ncbi:alpha/beta fold hydrolase [Corynebacterium poyangense]|uniref:Alpha/beta fold hydrolase n=1 Tax=Corynebacterium poyangense TaxID=2684405 RepID=A0A7H0SPH2_9CORY|nr:alpha/beta fold hydrolase [Corynebacterium poyangense]MBZ8178030.1 alpha/beta fold hydrolase [Corynebacterium poyangense]QNQ90447.1 alpha/beta fold hydrolase [Corynebacterium poyangense]